MLLKGVLLLVGVDHETIPVLNIRLTRGPSVTRTGTLGSLGIPAPLKVLFIFSIARKVRVNSGSTFVKVSVDILRLLVWLRQNAHRSIKLLSCIVCCFLSFGDSLFLFS